MRSASLLRVPKALRAFEEDRGPPGLPPLSVVPPPLIQVIDDLNPPGGSTWLVPPNVLALGGYSSAALRRSASRTQRVAIHRELRRCDVVRFANAASARGRSEVYGVAPSHGTD
jgi:hypothetical protein